MDGDGPGVKATAAAVWRNAEGLEGGRSVVASAGVKVMADCDGGGRGIGRAVGEDGDSEPFVPPAGTGAGRHSALDTVGRG